MHSVIDKVKTLKQGGGGGYSNLEHTLVFKMLMCKETPALDLGKYIPGFIILYMLWHNGEF